MPERQKRILEMLASNKINADEAHQLLTALKPEQSTSEDASRAETAAKARAKYLRVSVRPGLGHEHDAHAEPVDVRVPMALIRSGIRLTSLMPDEATDKVSDALHEQGIDFHMRSLKPEDLEELIDALSDLQVDVTSGKEVVKVFVQ